MAKAPAKKTRPAKRADLGAPIESYLAKLNGEVRAICDELVSLIRAAAPEATSELKWGMPVFSTKGIVCYFRAQSDYVRFGFAQGAELDDPDDKLEGEGESHHIKLRHTEDIDKKRLTSWLKAALKAANA